MRTIIAFLITVAGLSLIPAHAQAPGRQLVDDIVSICATPSGSLEESSAAVAALGPRYQAADDRQYAEIIAPLFHPGERIQPGLRRGFFGAGDRAAFLEFRATESRFGQVADFLVADQESIRALLIERLGVPVDESPTESGAQVQRFGSDSAPTLRLISRPGSAARVVCAMPVPQPPAQLSVEHQAELLADEAWQVCGLRAASLADAAPIIGLLQGRYRPVPGSALAVLRDSAGALVADADAGIEFVEQQHYFRTTEDGVVVLELTQQRQSRIDRVIANFRLIQLDPAVLIRAVERRFGRRDSIGVGEPLISGGRALDVASFGRYAPQEPDSRRLLMLLGGETISMHCFLREFQQRGSP